MGQNKLRYVFSEIVTFLTNRQFIYNLIGIILFLALVLFGVFTWLKIYTHHGQKLELPDYVDQELVFSIRDAKDKTFQIIVNDSVHIVGKPGGLIQNQNPPGGSFVKEKRKIYVTTTKFVPDKVDLSEEMFFGQEYEQVKSSLNRRNISATIKEYERDYLAPNSILGVWYKGEEVINRSTKPKEFVVDKGSTLEFVVSSLDVGTSTVPPLVGEILGIERFKLEPLDLNLNVIFDPGASGEEEGSLEIYRQDPEPGTELSVGDVITVYVRRIN